MTNKDVVKSANASNRSTPGPTSTQVKKLTGKHVDDFYLMMNKDTEKDIIKDNMNPYQQKNFIKDKQLKKEKARKNP